MTDLKEEVSLKGTIFFIKKVLSLLLSHKLFISIVVVLGVAIGLYRAIKSKPTYPAEVSFIMDSGQGGGKASMLLGLASQFGLGGGGMSGMTEDKLLFISKSKTVISSTLLKKSTIDGKIDFNINHFVRLKLQGKDLDDEQISRRVFITHDIPSQRSHKEDSLVNACTELFSDKLFMFSKTKEGIISVKLTLENEQLCKQLIDDLSASIINYFTIQTTQKKSNSYNLIKKTSDSLYSVLMAKEHQLASVMDGNQRMIKMQGRVSELELQRDIKILNVLYAESLKNLEVVRFDMLYNSPVIQVIDRPIYPLIKVKKSKIMAIAGGAFIGGLFASLILFIREFYKKYWKEQQ
jgi:hypothetical protein